MSNQFSLLLQSYYSHSFLFLFLVYNFWTTTMFKSECQKSWARGIRERCNVIRDSGKLASLVARRLRAELLRGYDNRQGSCVLCVCRWFKGQRTPRQTNPNWHTDTQTERERVRVCAFCRISWVSVWMWTSSSSSSVCTVNRLWGESLSAHPWLYHRIYTCD